MRPTTLIGMAAGVAITLPVAFTLGTAQGERDAHARDVAQRMRQVIHCDDSTGISVALRIVREPHDPATDQWTCPMGSLRLTPPLRHPLQPPHRGD